MAAAPTNRATTALIGVRQGDRKDGEQEIWGCPRKLEAPPRREGHAVTIVWTDDDLLIPKSQAEGDGRRSGEPLAKAQVKADHRHGKGVLIRRVAMTGEALRIAFRSDARLEIVDRHRAGDD